MELRFPSTKALRAFEAAARLGSIKAAADHLCVSPSALSKRIQALEEELGQILFLRDTRGLTLTTVGVNYAQQLQSVFKLLSDATHAARADVPQRLRILAPPLLGHLILTHLKHFETLYPDVKLSFDSFSGMFGTSAAIDDADVVILFGDGNWDGWESVLLTPNSFSVPVCAPGYLPKMPDDPRELANHTWIYLKHFEGLWQLWCDAVGCPGLQPKNKLELNDALMAKEAAVNGLGIWMGGGSKVYPTFPDFAAGRLVLAHPFHALRRNHGHYLAYRTINAGNPLILAFRNWLLNGIQMCTGRS